MSNLLQKIVLIMRKLGILRYGTAKYKYTSGKDMPAPALLDDVYDEKKDLVTKDDLGIMQNRSKD